MKIGIFGGSFDPPHLGHKNALEIFINQVALDKVIIIPSFIAPHKDAPKNRATIEDRMEMSRLAFSNLHPNMEFSDIEKVLYLKNGEKSYTYLTLSEIKKETDAEYIIYIGSDMFYTLDSWKNSEYLFENATFAVMERYKKDEKIKEYKEKFEKEHNAKIILLHGDVVEISSTELRKSHDCKNISDSVKNYIKEHKLYNEK